MATFYIQLENRRLQISGDLTTENISKALGYVPVSPNVTNELSQRVDNITFDSLKNNPFLQDGSGELNIVDEAGNIIAKIDAEGIHSVDFIAGTHKLSEKTDKIYVDEAVKNVKVDLTGYATEEYVNNIDFYNINNNPIVNNGDGKLLFVDENGYIGLQLEEDGLYVKDVIADGHTLSQKVDKSELSNYVTETELNDKGYLTEHQDISHLASRTWVESQGYAHQEELPDFSEFAKLENIPEVPSLDGYATEEWVNNKNYATEYDLKTIDFSSINNVPLNEDASGEFSIVDESGNVGMKVSSEAVYARDFVAGEHKLSEKVDKTYVDNSIAELVDGAPETLDTLNELSAALNDNADIVDVLNQSISNKQDAITDLETIRNNASKGAQALGAIPTKVSQLENDEGYLTSHQDISGLATKDELQGKVDKVTLAAVATSGNYNDLSNKPTIPTAVTESTVSGWGFTKNTGTYEKPENGIPKSDLNSSVQTSLNKADTALQSIPSVHNVTAIDANSSIDDLQTEYATKGYVDNAINNLGSSGGGGSIDLSEYATKKELEEGLVDKQEKLVNGKTIKTINGISLLGEGNIDIQGSSSSAEVEKAELRINILSSLGSGDVDIEAVTATLKYGSNTEKVSNGDTLLLPIGIEVTVEFPELTDYDKPEDVIITINEGDNVIEGTYTTNIVSMNVTTSDGVSTDGVKVVVQKISFKPNNFDLSVLDENHVAIMDIRGNFYATAGDWKDAGSPTPNGVAVSDGIHRFCIAMHNADKPICFIDGMSPIVYQQFGDTVSFSVDTYSDSFISDAREARQDFLTEFNLEDYLGTSDIGEISETYNNLVGYIGAKGELILQKILTLMIGAIGCGQDISPIMPYMQSFPNGMSGEFLIGGAGDWSLVAKHIYTIDNLFRAIGGTPLCNGRFGLYWTGTKSDQDSMWAIGIDFVNISMMNTAGPEDEDPMLPKTSTLISTSLSDYFTCSMRYFTAPISKIPVLESTSETLTVTDGKITFKLPTKSYCIATPEEVGGYDLPNSGAAFNGGVLDIQYIAPTPLPQYTVQAVNEDNNLIDWYDADSNCKGVVLTCNGQSFMIMKNDCGGDSMKWANVGDTGAPNYNSADGSNERGYLPTSTGFCITAPILLPYDQWNEGSLSDFNGKSNTEFILQQSGDIVDAINNANNSSTDTFSDWYIPSCGQLALMYLAKDELNEAFSAIGGSTFSDNAYWSSTEYDENYAWSINLYNGNVGFNRNGEGQRDQVDYYLRLIRDVVFE